jgi:hypothetical protein
VRRWLRVVFVGVLALLVSIDSASACRFLRSRCRPRCRTVACYRPQPAACSPCAVSYESISIATPQCCVPADGSAHAEIVESVDETIDENIVESVVTPVAPAEAPAAGLAVPAPLTPVPVAPASAEQPVPTPQFKSAKEILEESAAKEAAEAKAAEEAKAAAAAKAEEEAAEPDAEEPVEPIEQQKPAAEEMPEEEPATKEPVEEPAEEEPAVEEPAPKKAAEEEPAEEEENLFDEPDGDAGEKAVPAEKKTEEPEAEDDPFAGMLRAPNEPVRRWIDNTGLHETIGRLVEVHADHIRILKANGRHATVPFTRLSRHDQDYVSTTGERIAAEQRTQPAVHDTAGL